MDRLVGLTWAGSVVSVLARSPLLSVNAHIVISGSDVERASL